MEEQNKDKLVESLTKVASKEEASEAPVNTGSLFHAGMDEEKLMEYVEEVLRLFTERIKSKELTPLQVTEIISVALSASIYSTIPQDKLELIEKQSDVLVNRMGKDFQTSVRKKKPLPGAQLLAPARFVTYVASSASAMLEEIKAKVAAMKEETAASQEESTTE